MIQNRLAETVDLAVDLAGNCHRLYQEAPTSVRRLLNQAFFSALYVELDGSVECSELATPFAAMLAHDVVERIEAVHGTGGTT